jgi:hypothetical protein
LIAKLSERIGRSVKLSIKRGTQELVSDVEVGTRSESGYKIVELPNPTPSQIKVREAWLKVTR